MFAEVAFPIRSFQTFTYSIPNKYVSDIYIGTRVSVPFRNKTIQGIVVNIKETNSYLGSIKKIIGLVDNVQVVTPPLWELIKWVSKYYMTPIGKVANSVVPKSLSTNYKPQLEKFVKAKKKVKLEKVFKLKKTAPKQYLVYKIIKEKNIIHKVSSFKNIVSNPLQICISLKDKGLIKIIKKTILSDLDKSVFEPVFKNIVFNKDQNLVIQRIVFFLKKQNFKSFLLHGVTGSGKTEVYIEAVRYCLSQKRNAIILLPEISLTPQIAGRFRAVFGDVVAIWHSKLKAPHRSWTWGKICIGDFKIVIGARSAIFSPLKNVGLIIVDEEQESSFYQDGKEPRYHARDVALMRGSFEKSTVVVASATPSLESYYNFQQKKIEYLRLPKRYGGAKYPKVHIVDMLSNQEETGKFDQVISGLLQDKIEEKLDKNEQIILIQNRRGFSPIVKCNDCGAPVMCKQCKIALTYHKNKNKLVCHFCSFFVINDMLVCQECSNPKLTYSGTGTQKVEQLVKATFPKSKICRLDMDISKSSSGVSSILKSFSEEEFDILIGTQMVAKGLDFPNATLVGIINADLGLYLPDFRSTEKVFQLIYQAAGRSGRSTKKGEVVIQTYSPNSSVIKNAKDLNLAKFYEVELLEREELNYPPYSWLAKVEFVGQNRERLSFLIDKFKHNLKDVYVGLDILGPAPCFLEKLKNNYRFQLVFKSKKHFDPNGIYLHKFINNNFKNYNNKKLLGQNKINIYFDPISLI
tara:strand:+ start:1931 stop:4168 length:2238 start_codon:yes stop_codon:yes gene_type:complete